MKERKFALLNRVGGMDLNEKVTFEERLRGCVRVSSTELSEGRACRQKASWVCMHFKAFKFLFPMEQ